MPIYQETYKGHSVKVFSGRSRPTARDLGLTRMSRISDSGNRVTLSLQEHIDRPHTSPGDWGLTDEQFEELCAGQREIDRDDGLAAADLSDGNSAALHRPIHGIDRMGLSVWFDSDIMEEPLTLHVYLTDTEVRVFGCLDGLMRPIERAVAQLLNELRHRTIELEAFIDTSEDDDGLESLVESVDRLLGEDECRRMLDGIRDEWPEVRPSDTLPHRGQETEDNR